MRKATAVAISVTWFIVTAGVGAVVVPWWLTGWRAHPLPFYGNIVRVVGAILLVLGLIPSVHVFVQFVRAGGTPMPGAMPERLVVFGFNRYVRNPIYLGAVTVFVGEALLLAQISLLVYAAAAWVGVAAFVHWYEEPTLARRFPADYEEYRRAVPAWIPRFTRGPGSTIRPRSDRHAPKAREPIRGSGRCAERGEVGHFRRVQADGQPSAAE